MKTFKQHYWRKSTRSGGNDGGGCVECSFVLAGIVGVRDSKNRTGPQLVFSVEAWNYFLVQLKSPSAAK
ncbi:DUF397 domain-containing protein [Crossiella sp. CA198]|uniref:DUF397 domain-containing protein n=1 Tax=Crossiella sp. CA198 TaxID=3455607 RepID=UPI003F8D8145